MHNPYGTSTQDIGHAIHHVEKLFETVVGLVVRFEPKLPSWQQKFAAGWRARIVLPMLEWAVGTHANYTHHELSNGTPTLNHNAQALETKALFATGIWQSSVEVPHELNSDDFFCEHHIIKNPIQNRSQLVLSSNCTTHNSHNNRHKPICRAYGTYLAVPF